ncbi:MAG TPA: protein meaA [Aestuariivirgaceae bacterium]|nr:protein meaA [Aestuariivirgaceae bacterium]
MFDAAVFTRTADTPMTERDPPWIFRTYAGHSDARESNRLFRTNLAKGQTGLSVAFDLPTQLGYDCDHPMARGEVGKVGVPVSHLGDMRTLFDGIPLDRMNTSMTINATAAWLLALYVALAEERGLDVRALSGTTQNDIIKEYLSRGTYIFPPSASLKVTGDVVVFCAGRMPKWNPLNICSYHLQEAGATQVQEVAFALAAALALLDRLREAGGLDEAAFHQVVGRTSFFVNSGIRFIGEICKMRAFAEMWDEICLKRYGVTDDRLRRFRYGVQVNSLGLSELQPENNVYRILLEMLAVVLSKGARARAVQLPAWNEALGLPRAWDQQWSLRMQQIVAFETDLLEFGDIFEGSRAIADKVETLKREAAAELDRILAAGGAVSAVESGYMKRALVASHADRIRKIEAGDITIVGVNAFTETEPSGLAMEGKSSILTVDENVETEQREQLKRWRRNRDERLVGAALDELKTAAGRDQNIMPASIACAKAGATTGEWGATLRSVYGEYRAPTGVSLAIQPAAATATLRLRERTETMGRKRGRPVTILIGKPGLDGHSNGAEQIAERAADCGLDVVFEGIRLTPQQIADIAAERRVDLVGLSILSGSHVALAREIMQRLREAGMGETPVIVGGIIPADDVNILKQLGVVRVYTPKDYKLDEIIADILDTIEGRSHEDAA